MVLVLCDGKFMEVLMHEIAVGDGFGPLGGLRGGRKAHVVGTCVLTTC